MSAIGPGRVKTTWKYGTGKSSAWRSASHSLAAAAWHFWAVPVAARVVRDAQVGAVFAAFDMTAQRRRSAAFDRRHDLELAEAHMAGMGRTPSRPAMAEDVRHLDRRP